MTYFLVWILSLVVSAGMWFGLRAWFKHTGRPEKQVQADVQSELARVETVRHGRVDSGPFYVCMMWSLFVGGLIMLIGGPIHPSTIDAMNPSVQRMMSVVLCVGTGTCIIGFLSGTKYFRRNADLRDCYQMAVIATPANMSTLAVYAIAVGNTVHWSMRQFGLGAGGIIAVMMAHLLLAIDLHRETKRLDRRVTAALQSHLDGADDGQSDH